MKRNGLTLLQVKPSDSSRHDAGGICTRGGEEGQHSRWGEFVQPLANSWSTLCLKHIVNKGLMGIFEQTLERIVKQMVRREALL